ncbi:MAG TPA: FKBP-type peptidyl-prolyl cis-trans isomerase [Elusimicrobiota bacterium]|nr:FKBP-type peptidyl-prolyl cis-trans isomerase [Elusimicrobiota bacterium]
MTTWKRIGGLLLGGILLGACGHAKPADEPDLRYAQKPETPFEEAFVKEDGVRPITWGGWIKTETPGTGASPTADSVVSVNYRGTLTDGKEFDSSYSRGRPAVFSLRNVVSCWTNGVPMMKVGEKAKLVCPAATAYGDKGFPPMVPGGATLVFEIELLDILK